MTKTPPLRDFHSILLFIFFHSGRWAVVSVFFSPIILTFMFSDCSKGSDNLKKKSVVSVMKKASDKKEKKK